MREWYESFPGGGLIYGSPPQALVLRAFFILRKYHPVFDSAVTDAHWASAWLRLESWPFLDPRLATLLCQASDPVMVGKRPSNLVPPPPQGDGGRTGSVDVGHSGILGAGIGYPNGEAFGNVGSHLSPLEGQVAGS